MHRYERILVCVKTREDLRMLETCRVLGQGAAHRQVHLLHVCHESTSTEDGLAGEVTLKLLETSAEAILQNTGGTESVCVTATGEVLPEILRYAMEEDIDLIVLGRRSSHGRLARKVAHKATCSVLVVPQGATVKSSRILVPVRDTECSARAVNTACWLAGHSRGDVRCLNVFPVGSGYSKLGLSLEEQVDRLKKVAEHDVHRMLVGVDTENLRTETKCVADPYAHPVPIILEECEQMSADLIVVGTHGHTGPAGVLLGTVAEQLISESPVPVLVVKLKGEQVGVVRALLSLA